MERTWFKKEDLPKVIKLGRSIPFMIHGDTTLKQSVAYPTHTHGMTRFKLPEIFINAAAFGPQENSKLINMIAGSLILHKEYYKEFMEMSFLEMKTGVFVEEEDFIMCIRKVEPKFLAVDKAYNDDTSSKFGYAQIWVKGDDHVLVDEYYKKIGTGSSNCGPDCMGFKH